MSILFPTRALVTDRRYYEAGVRGRFEGNLRVERGSIDTSGPNGTIFAGVVFTIVRNGPGDVTVTFAPPFSAAPSVLSTRISNQVISMKGTYIKIRDSSSIRIVTYDVPTNSLEDGVFDFVAIGPS